MPKEKEKTYINSVEEFDKWIRVHYKQGMVYRGLKDCEWKSSASLYRRLEDSNLPKNIQRFITATSKLIQNAKEEGHHKEMKNLELLAELQHEGAATCLIDFTYNPLVALWFACQLAIKKQPNNEPEKKEYADGKIVALNTKPAGKFEIVGLEDWNKDIKDLLDESQLWKWSPPKQNHRIIAQQSVFILGKRIIEDKEIDETCYIHKKAKGNILLELERYGISGSSLFCDFSGFSQQNAWHKPYQDLTSDDHIHRAIHAYQAKDLEKAIENCNEAIEMDPQHKDAHYHRGLTKGYKGLADYDGAITDFDKMIKINPQHEDTYYQRALNKGQKGDFNGVIADLDKAIQINSQHERAYYFRGGAKLQINDYNGAITDFNQMIKIDPRYVPAYYFRAITKSKINDYDGAVADFNKTIEIDPRHKDAYYLRGITKSQKGDDDGAIADYNKAIEIDPQYGMAYYRRGINKAQKGNYDEAYPDLNKAIEINPQNENAHFVRGLIKRDRGDYEKAIADFDKTIEINSQNEKAHFTRGLTKRQKGDYDEAIVDFDKVTEINPQHADAYYYRGTAKSQKGNYEGAIADCNKAININPQHAKAYYHRGLMNYLLKNYEEAEKDYRKAKEITPDAPDTPPYNTLTIKENTYKYYFKLDGKIVHAGITNDLKRREEKHQQSQTDWNNGRIEQVGYITTLEAALEWEMEQRKKGIPVGP